MDEETERLTAEAIDAARSGKRALAFERANAALARGTRDSAVLARIGSCMASLGRPHEALVAADAAIALDPLFAQAHYQRGVALGMLNDVEQMRRAHERVLSQCPNHVGALASLALIASQSENVAEAYAYGARALACMPGHAATLGALAVADIAAGAFSAAAEKLCLVLGDPQAADDPRIEMVIAAAATAFDRRDRTAEAFAACEALNTRRRELHIARIEPHRAIDEVRRRIAYFDSCEAWPSRPVPPRTETDAAGHVFLLGFMRSGTTLLETILAGSHHVVAADEREFLADAAREFLVSDAGLVRLAAANEEELAFWRRRYWDGVTAAGLSVAGKVFVNKMPFNSLRLPLLARLFPEARVLLALRDPRDVVFSCFRNHFDITSMTFEFLRLHDCAAFYAAVMQLIAVYRQKLPLRVLECRYEDIVGNFPPTLHGICDFANIAPESLSGDISIAASAVDPRSPSAAQVRRGLYVGGIGQWRRYREQLQPVFPILAPWIGRFGYAAD